LTELRCFKAKRWLGTVAFAIAIASLLILQKSERNIRHSFAGKSYATVAKVVDGDTIRLLDGRIVRYIGIDAPEIGEPFYREARAANSKLVFKKKVRLEFDIQKFDRHGRVLAYVYVDSGKGEVFVNAELVRLGYATAYTVPPNVKYAKLFIKLQREAIKNGRGLWREKARVKGKYVGNRRTLIFHKSTCPYAREIAPSNRIFFDSPVEAFKAGYSRCKKCNP